MLATPTTPKPRRTLQRDRVLRLAHVKGAAGFTRRDAALTVGCYELASRIGELEAEGVTFDRDAERGKNTFGDPVHYLRYTLATAPPHVLARAGIAEKGSGP